MFSPFFTNIKRQSILGEEPRMAFFFPTTKQKCPQLGHSYDKSSALMWEKGTLCSPFFMLGTLFSKFSCAKQEEVIPIQEVGSLFGEKNKTRY